MTKWQVLRLNLAELKGSLESVSRNGGRGGIQKVEGLEHFLVEIVKENLIGCERVKEERIK